MIYKDYVYNRLFLEIKAIFCNIYATQIISYNINQTDRIALVYYHTRHLYIHTQNHSNLILFTLFEKNCKRLRLYFIAM